MPRFVTKQDRMHRAARALRGREHEMDEYDRNLDEYALAAARIDADFPDGWAHIDPNTDLVELPASDQERAAAMRFRAQLSRLSADTIRERTKVKYFAAGIEEELARAGVDPVALLAEVDEPDSGE